MEKKEATLFTGLQGHSSVCGTGEEERERKKKKEWVTHLESKWDFWRSYFDKVSQQLVGFGVGFLHLFELVTEAHAVGLEV